MQISKSTFDALAKKARRITTGRTYETGFGITHVEGSIVSYRAAHAALMACAPWTVEQVDTTTLIATGTHCSYTVTLAADRDLQDRIGQLITDQNGVQINEDAPVVNIVQVVSSGMYGHYVDGTARTVKHRAGKRWQLI